MKFDPTALLARPELAAHVAVIMALWAELDGRLAWFLSLMMARPGETINPGVAAMFSTVASMTAKLDMLRAALKTRVPEDLYREFVEKLAIQIRSRTKADRTPFAHCRWAISDRVPDAIIMIPNGIGFKEGVRMLSYTARDFQDVEQRITNLLSNFSDFESRVFDQLHPAPSKFS